MNKSTRRSRVRSHTPKNAPAKTPAAPVATSNEPFVRLAFSLPASEAALLHRLKQAPPGSVIRFRKSQLMRAALLLVRGFDAAQLLALVARLPGKTPARKHRE